MLEEDIHAQCTESERYTDRGRKKHTERETEREETSSDYRARKGVRAV